MLSKTRNGTRVLSFHHVLRVQNLLPITLRLTVLENTLVEGKRQSILGSIMTAQHDQEDEIDLMTPIDTTTHTTTFSPMPGSQLGFTKEEKTEEAQDDGWFAVLRPGEEAFLSILPNREIKMLFSLPDARGVESNRKEPLVLPSLQDFLRYQNDGFPEVVSGRFALYSDPDIELNLNFEMGFLFPSTFSTSGRNRAADGREVFLQIWCPLWIVNHTTVPLVYNFDPTKLKRSSQITVPYNVVDQALSLFQTSQQSSEIKTNDGEEKIDSVMPLSLTLFSSNVDIHEKTQSSSLYRTFMSRKEEKMRRKKMNRLHVATRGIESSMYRRHYTDLSKTLSAQFILQNDTPFTLKFVRADLGDSCMWYEQRSKMSKTLVPGDTFCAVLVENSRSVLPVMELYAKLVFHILDDSKNQKGNRTVTFTISTSRQSPGQFKLAHMETALPYHGAIRIHGKSDSSYVNDQNADLSSDSASSVLAWTPTAAFALYHLDLSDRVMEHLRTSGILMKRGRYAGISSWKRRRFYCSAGGLRGDATRVSIESERDGWPRLMWRREEDMVRHIVLWLISTREKFAHRENKSRYTTLE